MHPKKFMLPHRAGRQSFALVATLALIAVATILLVLFVTTTGLDRTASYSYSQSVRADEIGLGGLHLLVGQLQAEMSKDAPPDTNYSGAASYYAPIFTNVTSANIAPQANVTNVYLPTLLKMSTNNNIPFYSGTVTSSSLVASSISTTAPSLNSRSVSTNIWNQAYFGQFPSANAAPYWVLMTRNGPSSGSGLTFGTTGNTVNNPQTTNPNYTLGRIAYAVYDESGLLDVTSAGYDPTSFTSPSQVLPMKGTLAGADLTQVGISNPSAFIQWRNAASDASTNAYLSYVTNFAATNGFLQVAAGDTTFLGRQDLIKAAQNGTGGLTTAMLTNLTTFTRELNAPSWAPSVAYVPTTNKYKYTANALTLTTPTFAKTAHNQNPNPFIPFVRYQYAGTVTAYKNDGTTYTYQVNVGDPVVQQRFPLDRLRWITPKGPSALLSNTDPFYSPGGTVAAIRACFGLVWGPSENKGGDGNWTTTGVAGGPGINVWKYYGSSLTAPIPTTETSTTISPVSTLEDVAGIGTGTGVETVPRAPNFFELLQAGMLSGSLGVNYAGGSNQFASVTSSDQVVLPLQLLRTGASMIAQVQPQAYPICIEYNYAGYSTAACGIANLPYLNVLKFVGGQSVDDPDQSNPSTNANHQIGIYGLIGLWNPHQRSSVALTRPPIRLYIQGELDTSSAWGTPTQTVIYSGVAYPQTSYGSKTILAPNTYYIQLASSGGAGAAGFQNPYGIESSDVDTTTSDGHPGTSTSAGWAAAPSSMATTGDIDAGVIYEAFRLPDLFVNFNLSNNQIPGNPNYGFNSPSYAPSKVAVIMGGTTSTTATANPFQLILKYQDSSGNWVPYEYFDGVNNQSTWIGSYSLFATQMPLNPTDPQTGTAVKTPYPLPTFQETLHPTSSTVHGGAMICGDPRCLRFGFSPLTSDAPTSGAQAGYGVVNDLLVDSIWSGYNTAHTSAPKVLSPFDLSGYGGNGSGTQSTPGLLPSGEMNAIPTFMANYYFPAYLPRNNTSYPNSSGTGPGSYFTAYQDTDGIQRIGDSGLFPTTVSSSFAGFTGNPYYDPNDQPNVAAPRTSDRPIVLNRPFASVGELGYVFRDDPFRSLDFFSVFNNISTSGDSGLLDLFSVTDTPSSYVAGRVNLNTQNPLVLQALLNNTLADPVGGSLTISSTAAAAIPTALTTFTQTTPLVNKDQLVTKFNPTLTSADFSGSDEQNVKAYREASIRAMADVGQTRTWNLMIDLVAQSGKYPPTATSLDQFEVDGERHYWLHVAIDRFTGKVVDRQLELIGP